MAGTIEASSITLSQKAQWATERERASNHRLRNGYRTRFAYVEGRRFRVEAEHLTAPWWVCEVTEEGVEELTAVGAWVFRLSEAREQIAEWVNSGERVWSTS